MRLVNTGIASSTSSRPVMIAIASGGWIPELWPIAKPHHDQQQRKKC